MGSNHDVATIDDQPRIPLARLALDLTDRSVRAETVTRVHRVREIPDRAEMAIVPIPPAQLATMTRVPAAMTMRVRHAVVATVLTRLALLETVTRVHASQDVTAKVAPGHPEATETNPTLHAPLGMAMRDRRVLAETVPTRLALREMANVRILRVPPEIAMRVRHERAVTVPTHLAPRETVTRVRHALAVTGPILLVLHAMVTGPIPHALRATATRVRHVLVETAPIRRVPPGTALVRTGLEAIVLIGLAVIGLMAISRVESGNLMGESDARSGRR